MVTLMNTTTGRRIRTGRGMLNVLGGNWVEVKDAERMTPKEKPPITEPKDPLPTELEEVSRKDMISFLRAKKIKAAHLMKFETLKKRYEAEKQRNG